MKEDLSYLTKNLYPVQGCPCLHYEHSTDVSGTPTMSTCSVLQTVTGCRTCVPMTQTVAPWPWPWRICTARYRLCCEWVEWGRNSITGMSDMAGSHVKGMLPIQVGTLACLGDCLSSTLKRTICVKLIISISLSIFQRFELIHEVNRWRIIALLLASDKCFILSQYMSHQHSSNIHISREEEPLQKYFFDPLFTDILGLLFERGIINHPIMSEHKALG